MKTIEKAFENYGIEYLSPSAINKFRKNPAKWLVNIAGYREKIFAPAMTYGIAIEKGISMGVMTSAPMQECIDKALQEYDDIYEKIEEAGVDYDYKKCLEKQVTVPEVLEVVIPQYRQFGKPISAQEWVEIYLDLPIPFRGIIDFLYDDCVRDLKTTGQKPQEVKTDYQNQLSIYSIATSKKPFVDYVYSTKYNKQLITYEVRNVEDNVKNIRRIAMKMWQLLSFSSDIHEVCAMSCLEPDISNEDFMNQWSATEIKGAQILFDMKN
tara:strand:- start:1943 stop:2743 length:801 start_codon:yes stop_codon:yes gene_type:complete